MSIRKTKCHDIENNLEYPPVLQKFEEDEDLEDLIIDEDGTDDEDGYNTFGELDVNDVLEIHYEFKEEEETSTPTSAKQPRLANVDANWVKTHPTYNIIPAKNEENEDILQSFASFSPLELFEKIMNHDILEYIRDEAERYANSSKNEADFCMCIDELKTFIGILLFSGYHTVPSERMYWFLEDDVGVPLIQNAMSRNRYVKIKSCLNFNENINNEQNKQFKIRHLVEMFKRSFQQFGCFTENISVDEMSLKYYGHNTFDNSKPARLGYKLWAICSHDGYCFNFIINPGKEISETSNLAEGFNSIQIVTKLLEIVESPEKHTLFLNHIFTTPDLLNHLKSIGFRATGAIKENRMERCPIRDNNVMQTEELGSFDYSFDRNREVLIVKWKDSKCLTVGTNFDTILPMVSISRRSKPGKVKKQIQVPTMIKNYHLFMVGVDQHDFFTGKYAITIKGKKWYWPLFTRLIDMSITNSWIIYRRIHGFNCMSILDFRRAIAVTYLKNSSKKTNISYQAQYTIPDVRFDKKDHLIVTRKEQRRCQREGCKSRPKTYCKKCGVTLCKTCFEPYHLL